MKRVRKKVTKRFLDSLSPPPSGTPFYVVSDTEDDGLRVRVLASGKMTFGFEYYADRRARYYTFGTFGPMTVDQARSKAVELRAMVERGENPADAKAAGLKEPTFAEYASRWVESAKLRKKPSSLRNDELLLRLYLLPALGKRRLRDIVRKDIERIRDGLSKKPTTANRLLALASTIFNAAEAGGERDPHTNPCRHVQRNKERRIERPLTNDEFSGLWAALDASDEAPAAVAAIRFLVLTGLRCGEALALRWEDVDTKGARVHLRDSKTGARRVLLSAPAVRFLESLPDSGDFVFPGKPDPITGDQRPVADLTHPWQRIRATAGLEGVRLHDLRHAFASAAISAGLSLPEIGKLLGHRNVATTQRYAHLIEETEQRATDIVGDAIDRAVKTPRLRLVS